MCAKKRPFPTVHLAIFFFRDVSRKKKTMSAGMVIPLLAFSHDEPTNTVEEPAVLDP